MKGVRGHKRLSLEKPRILKEKKCKKYKEPKAEPKAVAEPKAMKDKAIADKAEKEAEETKAIKDKGGRRRYLEEIEDAAEPKGPPAPKATKEDPKLAKEAECLEWEMIDDREDGAGAPIMTSTGTDLNSVNLDCSAIANDKGPTDTNSVSFMVNIDVVKETEATLSKIYKAMEQELQQKVAPRIAGCSSARKLAQSSSTKIVHVDFKGLEFDKGGTFVIPLPSILGS